jgi:phosphatidate phosphatase APP1
MAVPGSFLHRFFHAAIADLERDLDRIEDGLQLGEGHSQQVRLLAYAGYRNTSLVRVKGRVVRYRKPLDAREGTLSRLRAMMEIYNSHELPGIQVEFEGYGQRLAAATDEEGYVTFEVPISDPLPETTQWEHVLLSTPGRGDRQDCAKVPIIAPGADHNWGIISDIDDTVIETGATDFLKNWRRVLIERPQDRLAVPGASKLYKTIAGDNAAPARPFFYVSSSPWNLYGFITEFMDLNGIPHGPMFLKDYGIDSNKLINTGHEEHKLKAIEEVLSFYPESRFLMIGDNGQRDVTIYADAVGKFGERVAGVFIRDVDGSCRSGVEGDLLSKIEAAGVPTFCGSNFEEAVEIVKSLDLEQPLQAAKAIFPK